MAKLTTVILYRHCSKLHNTKLVEDTVFVSLEKHYDRKVNEHKLMDKASELKQKAAWEK